VEDAYWRLIAAEDEVRVAEKSLETARALLEQTRTQYDVGVVSKVEVVEAEAGVAEREVNRIQTRNAYENQQDVLIDLVLGPGLRAESTLEIEATDRPEDYIAYEIDVPEAVERAFENRPELAVARQEIERGEVQLKFAKNQRLPSLDAVVSYGQQVLSGRENKEPIPIVGGTRPAFTSSYGDAQEAFFSNDAGDQFSARALFSIPIPNTTARSEVSKSELELRRSRVEQRRLEQNIILEVRRSARDLEAAQQGIEAAERRRLASEEQLRAERIRLEYGESTPFDVLDRERDLVDAESQKIRALQGYRSSVTNLDRAQGTILRNRNIAIDDVSALR
jgi:outer membrane protein TolC